MPRMTDLTEAPRKELPVFYVLDTSGSMSGARISSLNHAMEECLIALQDLAKSNADAKLKISVLEFNSGCKWMTAHGPEPAEDFEYEPLTAGGLTSLGAALKELNSKLSTKEYLGSMVGSLMPVIIFMTDGEPTDEYEAELAAIRQNRWFRYATKIGFAVGDGANEQVIASVVGNSEAVITTTDLALFRKLMKFVTVTASKLVSQSATPETAVSGAGVVQDAKKQLGLDDNITPNLAPSQYSVEPPVPDSDSGSWDSDDDWT